MTLLFSTDWAEPDPKHCSSVVMKMVIPVPGMPSIVVEAFDTGVIRVQQDGEQRVVRLEPTQVFWLRDWCDWVLRAAEDARSTKREFLGDDVYLPEE